MCTRLNIQKLIKTFYTLKKIKFQYSYYLPLFHILLTPACLAPCFCAPWTTYLIEWVLILYNQILFVEPIVQNSAHTTSLDLIYKNLMWLWPRRTNPFAWMHTMKYGWHASSKLSYYIQDLDSSNIFTAHPPCPSFTFVSNISLQALTHVFCNSPLTFFVNVATPIFYLSQPPCTFNLPCSFFKWWHSCLLLIHV